MALPPDPAAFVAAAERGINDRDLDATVGVYAADARVESVTDGAEESFSGTEAVRTGWEGYLAAMGARDFRLRKRLLTATGDLIVNDWTGSVRGRTRAEGIEYWRFDEDRLVREHRMLSFLNVKPSTSPLQRLRLAFTMPVTAMAFLREQRRARG